MSPPSTCRIFGSQYCKFASQSLATFLVPYNVVSIFADFNKCHLPVPGIPRPASCSSAADNQFMAALQQLEHKIERQQNS